MDFFVDCYFCYDYFVFGFCVVIGNGYYLCGGLVCVVVVDVVGFSYVDIGCGWCGGFEFDCGGNYG